MENRNEFIKLAFKNGITDFDTIVTAYNIYALGGEYKVKKGDTLSAIAKSNNITLDTLLSFNPQYKSNPNKIIVGDTINLDKRYNQSATPLISYTYKIKKGDTLYNISKKYNVSLDTLIEDNPQLKNDPNKIIAGDTLNINTEIEDIYKDKSIKEKTNISIKNSYNLNNNQRKKSNNNYVNIEDLEIKEREYNKTNLGAIQNYKHNKNYVVIDKKNRKLTVYDKNNKVVYTTNQINTGKSKNDYNTITYVDNDGKIRNNAGNNSTPAGITIISGVGTYHGVPSFTRAKVDNYGNMKTLKDSKGNTIPDNIASSLHFGNIREGAGSNGCVRIGGEQLKKLAKYIGEGTRVYTLPEKEKDSRFELKQGKLNFKATNPYGESEGEKRFWDDYNTSNDKSYSPLKITLKDEKFLKEYSDDYTTNVKNFITTIEQNKESIQKQYNLDSYTYDKLAQLAVGIAEQETKFGTAFRKKIKDYTPDFVLNTLRGNSNRSRGITQIKINGDNKETKEMYNSYDINEDNIDDIKNSAIATMLRLTSMYNNEVRGRHFKGKNNKNLSPYDVLLYKWMGKNDVVKSKEAVPENNTYIQNVKNYYKKYNFKTKIN